MATSGEYFAVHQQARGLAKAAPASGFNQIIPALVLLYSTLLPQEVRFQVADFVFYSYRIVGILLLPVVVHRLIQTRIHWHFVDTLVVVGALWMIASFAVYYGLVEGIPRAGALALDVLSPYFVARTSIRDLTDFRRFLIYAAPGLLLAGGAMLVEAVLHQSIVKPAASAIFGQLSVYQDGQMVGEYDLRGQERFGLLRAYGPFSHPILGGIYLASFMTLYFTSGVRGWPFILGLVAGLMSFFSVSTAAFLVLIITVLLMVFDRVQSQTAILSWKLLLLGAALLLIALEFLTENGAVRTLSRFAFSPSTAFNRIRIWEVGSASVSKNPYFGIGFTAVERPRFMRPSIDNEWMLLAVRHGILTGVCLFAAAVGAIVALARSSRFVGPRDRHFMVAMAISLFALTFSGFSVAFFGGMNGWFWMLVGLSISIASGIRADRAAQRA